MTRTYRLAGVLVLFLAAGFMGCAHCDTCDEMPQPCLSGHCSVGGHCGYTGTGHEECCLVRLKRKIKNKLHHKHGHDYTEYVASAQVPVASGQVALPVAVPTMQIPVVGYPTSQFAVNQAPVSQYMPSAPLAIERGTPPPPPVPDSTTGGDVEDSEAATLEPPPAPRVDGLQTPPAASAPLSELPQI